MAASKKPGVKRQMTEPLTVRVQAALKAAVGDAADEARLPMNEFVANILAKAIGRPELAEIPRKSFGRPRKELAEAS